ncbi:CHAT domain-containing protein [Streptomyces atratus]|uniref:CHAT domain-containing protein n=1 Tax=Streptomyces atratus TaxID=1893 RepID=UPI0021A859E5|nr:CHAT domain-containing protein [Streptomyces atratus]MCT2548142.1 CHAT domain-containing protein [Streptomyces atratus]
MSEELRGRAAEAVRAAGRLMEGGDWKDETWLGPAIDELLSLERELIQNEEDFSDVFVQVALLIGARCHIRRDGTTLDPDERAEALRRLRWVDRHGPLDAPIAVLSRMMLLFLLMPWALPRADGSRTALQNALLDVADGRVLTEAVRRDLVEAREVIDRIAEAPVDEEFRRQTESNREIIEQMLAPGSTRSARSVSDRSADGADHAAAARAGTDPAPSAQSELLEAVRELVDLADSCSTARFARVLVWLIVEFSAGRGGDPTPDDPTLDPESARLVRRAGAGRAAGADGVRRAADLVLTSLRATPPDTPQRARVARLHAYLLLQWEFLTGEPADFSEAERPTPEPDGDSTDRLAEWPIGTAVDPGVLPYLDSHVRDFVAHTGIRERQSAAHLDRLLAYRTGDPGYLDDAAALLREAIDASPAGSWWGVSLQAELVGILEQAAVHGGSFHDADVALTTLRELRAALERDGSVPPDSPFVLDLALSAAGAELSHARRTGNHGELPRLGEELRGRHAALPPDSDRRGALEERITELDALLPPARQEARTPEGALEPARPEAAEPEILYRAISEFRRDLDGPRLYHDYEYDRRSALGLRMLFDVVRGEGPGELLDEAITELTRVRMLITEGRGQTHRVDVLTKLAEAHLMRAARGGPHRAADQRACIEVFREALGELAADVLLQSGADHGLSAALNGAMLSRRLAFIAFRINRPVDAVADLERGRALVLQSAAATRGIPALLDAAGHPGLARQWRAQVFAHPIRPTAATAPGAGEPQASDDTPPIPSGLRRKALKALGAGRGAAEGPGTRPLLGATGPADLSAGLAATDTDALVYLVAGVPMADGGFPGRALILRPGAAPAAVALPELLQSGSPPLDRYLEAAAERSRVLTDPEQGPAELAACEGRWQMALDALCDWAWRAVMGPVLGAVRPLLAAQWPLARPPRIVLVPCGPLGVVPWHAARIRGLGEHGHRYACQEAVLSYAPSGAQFLAAAGRRRMSLATGPQVLVADPELTLPWAELETAALRSACYAGALRYGEFFTADGERDAAGTPEDLLAVLPGGTTPASLVHLSCHAVAAPRPTDSELRLAVPPGAGADEGRLTVAGILDASADRGPGTAGPLIVLSACETDLSAGHHDEALTLATALVTGGAADVVGSRWAVRDGPTSVMMAVFHHHLTARGLAPPDALRAAQLWMLDPHRTPPPTLDGPLRAEAARPDLHRLHHWAAFTHQGNPTASGG